MAGQPPTINEEAGLGPNWVPLDGPPIIPGQMVAAPPASDFSPTNPKYLQGSISPSFQHDSSFVDTGDRTAHVPKFDLMPLGPQENAVSSTQITSTVKSTVEVVAGQNLLLETDGIRNPSQNILNIVGAGGISAVSDANGGVTISGGGDNLITYPTLYAVAQVASWLGFTIFGCIRGSFIKQTANSWNFTMAATGGSGMHVAAAVVLKTLHNDLNVISSTPVTFGGVIGNITFGYTASRLKPFFLVSDTINLAIDVTHDYWIALYFDNDGVFNGSLAFPENTTGQISVCGIEGGYLSGNQTAATPINTSFSSGGDGYLIATKVS